MTYTEFCSLTRNMTPYQVVQALHRHRPDLYDRVQHLKSFPEWGPDTMRPLWSAISTYW
jgi:N-acetyl-gamma-glutamylphosphate reductase